MSKNIGRWGLFGAGAILLDQLSKVAVFALPESTIATLGFVHFKNQYFAFGLPVPTGLMFGIYIIVLFLCSRHIVLQWVRQTRFERLGWVLILAGGVSNVVERAIRGSVRDFIPLLHGVFNIADIYILCGIGILLVVEFKQKTIKT